MILNDQPHYLQHFCGGYFALLNWSWRLMRSIFLRCQRLAIHSRLLLSLWKFSEEKVQSELILDWLPFFWELKSGAHPCSWWSWRCIDSWGSRPSERVQRDRPYRLMLAVNVYYQIWDFLSGSFFIFLEFSWIYRNQMSSQPSHAFSTFFN